MEGGTYSLIYPGLSAFDGGCTDPWKKDRLLCPHDPRISEEAYPTGLKSLSMAGPIHGISGGRTTRPENVIPASLFGREDGSLALIKDQYSPVDTTSNFKVSSTFAEIMREKRASVSFRPARRPSGIRRAPERSYSCDTCGEQYSQPQGVSRHRRRAHNPHACLCCEFKWSRPYQYRDHLEKHHPDVDRDYILGKRAGSRRRSTIIGRDLPHYIPLPAIQPDRRSGAEPQQRPLAPPLSMPTKFTHASSSAISPVTSDPQPKYAEQVMSTNKVEDVRGLEYQFLGTIDPAPMFSSGEGIQSVTTRIFPSEVAKFGYRECRRPTLGDSLPTANLTQ